MYLHDIHTYLDYNKNVVILLCTKETVHSTPTYLHYNNWPLWYVETKRSAALLHTYTTINGDIVLCRKEAVYTTPICLHYNKWKLVVCRKATVYSTPTYLHYNKCGHCFLYKWNGVQHSYIPTLIVCTYSVLRLELLSVYNCTVLEPLFL